MVVGVEIVNFLAVLDQDTFSDIVMNFTALVIISEFDDFFYSTYDDSELKSVISDSDYANLLMIRRTSSVDATVESNQNLMTVDQCEKGYDSDNNLRVLPKYIYVNFLRDRSCTNKLLYTIYRIIKCLYTSVWFYFMPYAIIICSYTIPLIHRQNADQIDYE